MIVPLQQYRDDDDDVFMMERPSKMKKLSHQYGTNAQTKRSHSRQSQQQGLLPFVSEAPPAYSSPSSSSSFSTPGYMGLPVSAPVPAYQEFVNPFTADEFHFGIGIESSSTYSFDAVPAFAEPQNQSTQGLDPTNFWPMYSSLSREPSQSQGQAGRNISPSRPMVSDVSQSYSPTPSYVSAVQSPASLDSSYSRAEDGSWCPRQPSPLHESLPQTKQKLTGLLSQLRCQQDHQSVSSDPVFHKEHSQELFALVLSLWTSLRSVAIVRWDDPSSTGPVDPEVIETTFRLSFMALSVVLEMYKCIAIACRRDHMANHGSHKKTDRRTSLSTANSNAKGNNYNKTLSPKPVSKHLQPIQQNGQSMQRLGTVQPALDTIVRLTVMECHLVGLEQVFQKLDAFKPCKELLTGNRLSVADFQSMRINITGLIDDFKKIL